MSIIEELIQEAPDDITFDIEKQDGSAVRFSLHSPSKISLKKKAIEDSIKHYSRIARIAVNPQETSEASKTHREFAEKLGMNTTEGLKELASQELWESAVFVSTALIEPAVTVYEAAHLVIKREDIIARIGKELENRTKQGNSLYNDLKNE